MKKEKIVHFLKELICYVMILLILLLIARKFRWTDTSIWDNVIGLTIGWIVWRVITGLINKKNQ